MTSESAVVNGNVSRKKQKAEPGRMIAQRKQAAFRTVLPGAIDAPGQHVTPATNYPPSLKFNLFL